MNVIGVFVCDFLGWPLTIEGSLFMRKEFVFSYCRVSVIQRGHYKVRKILI